MGCTSTRSWAATLWESIDQPLDAMLEGLGAEVEQEPHAFVRETQVVQELCIMAGMMVSGCLGTIGWVRSRGAPPRGAFTMAPSMLWKSH